jgi:hypothetical protein
MYFFSLSHHIHLDFSCNAKRHNARINRARAKAIQATPQGRIMKEMLSRAPVE